MAGCVDGCQSVMEWYHAFGGGGEGGSIEWVCLMAYWSQITPTPSAARFEACQTGPIGQNTAWAFIIYPSHAIDTSLSFFLSLFLALSLPQFLSPSPFGLLVPSGFFPPFSPTHALHFFFFHIFILSNFLCSTAFAYFSPPAS